jgi:hypothetical protein
MQFRKQGNRIQVLAYRGYDREKRRAVVKLLGSINAYSYEPTDKLKNNMTVEEKEELQAYIEKMRQDLQDRHLHYASKTIAQRLVEVAGCIDSGAFEVSEQWAAEAWGALDHLAKTLRKAGFPRPRKEKKAKDATYKARLERKGQQRLLD